MARLTRLRPRARKAPQEVTVPCASVRSIGRASLLSVALALVLVTSVFAHECYNASASAQGALSKAEHSQTWVLAADVREIISTGGSGFFPQGSFPVLDACQQEVFLGSLRSVGPPRSSSRPPPGRPSARAASSPRTTRTLDTTLGGNNKGIDHFGVTGDAILAAVGAGYNAAYASACQELEAPAAPPTAMRPRDAHPCGWAALAEGIPGTGRFVSSDGSTRTGRSTPRPPGPRRATGETDPLQSVSGGHVWQGDSASSSPLSGWF